MSDELRRPPASRTQEAKRVLAFRHGDESDQLGDLGPDPRGMAAAYEDWTGYRPANALMRLLDPNRWQPLPTADGMGAALPGPPTGACSSRSLWRPAGSSRLEPAMTPAAELFAGRHAASVPT